MINYELYTPFALDIKRALGYRQMSFDLYPFKRQPTPRNGETHSNNSPAN